MRPANPSMRWVVVRKPHIVGHWHYSDVIRGLIGDREPVAVVPPRATHNQVQILIYDRCAPPSQIAASTKTHASATMSR